jgi:hypothetical protein
MLKGTTLNGKMLVNGKIEAAMAEFKVLSCHKPRTNGLSNVKPQSTYLGQHPTTNQKYYWPVMQKVSRK